MAARRLQSRCLVHRVVESWRRLRSNNPMRSRKRNQGWGLMQALVRLGQSRCSSKRPSNVFYWRNSGRLDPGSSLPSQMSQSNPKTEPRRRIPARRLQKGRRTGRRSWKDAAKLAGEQSERKINGLTVGLRVVISGGSCHRFERLALGLSDRPATPPSLRRK